MNTSLKNRIAAEDAARPNFNGVDFDAMPDALLKLAKHGRALARLRTGQAITAALARAQIGDFVGAWEISGNGISFGSPAARYFHRRA